MGLQHSNGGGRAVFYRINAKEGCIQHYELDDDGKPIKNAEGKNLVIKEPPGTRLVGTLAGISLEEDEYKGQKNYRVRLALLDTEPGKPKMYVDFPFGSEAHGASFFGLQLMARLNAADPAKPIALMPWMIPAGTEYNGKKSETDRSGVTVYQDGQKLKEDFGDGETRLPERRKITVRGKEQVDPSDTSWDDVAQKLFESLRGKLTPGAGENSAPVEADDFGDLDPGEIAGAVEAASQAEQPRPARPRFGG